MVHGCTKYVRKGNDVQIHTGKPAVPTATPNRQPFAWPKLLTENGRGIAFGGDYNPDQWPEEIWDDDIRLMEKAGVNTVALAIFSWDRIQPTEDRWDFGWLDRIIEKLGKAGIATDLASATATAPLWLYEKHPEVLPRDKYGHQVNAGSRQSWSPTSPVFKEYALTLCRKLAERYGSNPYVTAWHMGNEYGWNNREDYSDNALEAFRAWCRRKYGTIDALNQAWGTTFWGQEMNGFDEVLIPRFMGADSMVNPGQKLDFMANLDQSWIGVDVTEVFSEACGRPVVVVNDADAAGLAEVQFGAAKGQDGLVIATTLGTGIGTALIYNGVLIPNTELGHIILSAKHLDAEKYASSAIRENEELGYKKWAKRLTKYYGLMEKYFNPDLFTVGGGVSRQSEKFLPYVDIKTPIVPAKLRNQAGIVGAAYYASTKQQ